MYFRFMDDVTFGRSGPYGDACKAELLTYYHWRRCDTGAESDVHACLIELCIFLHFKHIWTKSEPLLSRPVQAIYWYCLVGL